MVPSPSATLSAAVRLPSRALTHAIEANMPLSCLSRCKASRDRLEHRETDGWQDLLHEHVYRLGHGYGGDLRERAVSALALAAG